MMINLTTGAELPREELMRRLVDDRYERNDIAFERNMFRVRGDTIELWPAYWASSAIRVEYFGDEIDRISEINPVTGAVIRRLISIPVWPASHYVTTKEEDGARDLRDPQGVRRAREILHRQRQAARGAAHR